MAENLLERAMQRLDDKYDPGAVAAVEKILKEHFAALDPEHGALQDATDGIRILLLKDAKLITIDVRIAAGSAPSVSLEVRGLRDVVVSLETFVAQSGRRESKWTFRYPDGQHTDIAGINEDELEQFARAVAASAGTPVWRSS